MVFFPKNWLVATDVWVFIVVFITGVFVFFFIVLCIWWCKELFIFTWITTNIYVYCFCLVFCSVFLFLVGLLVLLDEFWVYYSGHVHFTSSIHTRAITTSFGFMLTSSSTEFNHLFYTSFTLPSITLLPLTISFQHVDIMFIISFIYLFLTSLKYSLIRCK